jgi:uncharacterized membrane protein YhaH (DUF805 family)
MSDTADWFYVENGQKAGPRSRSGIEALIADGTIGPDTLVWSDEMTDWAAARTTEFRRHFRGVPPPLAAGRVPPPSQEPATPGPGGPAPGRSMGEAVRVCFSNYFTFSGRASRSEFWWFTLFNWIVGLLLIGVDYLLGSIAADGTGLFSSVYGLAAFFPGLAVSSRRFHDAGWRFWWYLMVFVPILGWLLILYILVSRPEPGPNRFDRPA